MLKIVRSRIAGAACWKLPFSHHFICLTTFRKSCEHTCFLGAAIDLIGFMFHYEAMFVVGAGKLAFVMGALGVYLVHIEENGVR